MAKDALPNRNITEKLSESQNKSCSVLEMYPGSADLREFLFNFWEQSATASDREVLVVHGASCKVEISKAPSLL